MAPYGGKWTKSSKKQGSLTLSALPKVIVIKKFFGDDFVHLLQMQPQRANRQTGQGPQNFPKESLYVFVS